MMTCEQAQLLANLARLIKAKKALDLGRRAARGLWEPGAGATLHPGLSRGCPGSQALSLATRPWR